LDHVDVKTARALDGLRLVLTVGGPGPWSEAAKGFFRVKQLAFTPVAQHAGAEDPALRAWTGQTSAPVAAWNDEPPLSRMSDILLLAERLAPEPALLPADPRLRAWTLGMCREISGRNGLGWSKRLCMLDAQLARQREGPGREQTRRFCQKFGHDPAALPAARERVIAILHWLADELAAQQARGSQFLIADQLSAADVLWASFAALFAPLPAELCPMSDGLRRLYTETDRAVLDALDPRLLAHRDRIYREHLGLPLDF
jgi:glutathione S-transferase